MVVQQSFGWPTSWAVCGAAQEGAAAKAAKAMNHAGLPVATGDRKRVFQTPGLPPCSAPLPRLLHWIVTETPMGPVLMQCGKERPYIYLSYFNVLET